MKTKKEIQTKTPLATNRAQATKPSIARPRSVDGFAPNTKKIQSNGHVDPPKMAKKTSIIPQLVVSTTKLARIPNHASAHKPQGATTLMRTAVSKPGDSFKKLVHVQTALEKTTNNLLIQKTSVGSIVPQRQARANAAVRSQHVSRFGGETESAAAVTFGVAHIPVHAAPGQPDTEPVDAPKPMPSNKPTLDMFEQAIANASHFVDIKGHGAAFRKKSRRHASSMAAAALALVVIGGFAIFQNSPGLQVRLAGMQAGVATTSSPNFKAAGFAFNGVTSQSGKLVIGFSSPHGANYQLTQSPTNWSSDDMIQNVSSTDASGYPNYQTVTAGSTPVYRFSNSSATWVKNGKLYQVSGQSSLSNDQVKALATNS